jgi:RNA polymerase sigma factor (sigma-70 family)
MDYTITKQAIIADYYTFHYEELFAFVASRLHIYSDEAEDIVQNIFLRLLQTDKMITPITLPCLVYTMARHLISDFWRHRKRVEEHEHFIQGSMGTAGCGESVEMVYSVVEITELMERGIARLSEKQRKVYRLNVCDGMKVGEICRELGLNYKCVENRLGAARKEVRGYMKRMLA